MAFHMMGNCDNIYMLMQKYEGEKDDKIFNT